MAASSDPTGFTYRTFNPAPPDYERELADALFTIMGQRIHAPTEIAAGLNRTGIKPAVGDAWTADRLKAEMQRLGTWTNCIGAPVGSHSHPGVSERKMP